VGKATKNILNEGMKTRSTKAFITRGGASFNRDASLSRAVEQCHNRG
jgi:hypothetical protein